MSSIIKINPKFKKVNVLLNGSEKSNTVFKEGTEDFLQKQLKRAYENGYLDAEKELQDKYKGELSASLEARASEMQHLLNQIDLKVIEYEESFERLVINLSVAVAEKILQREVVEDTIINDVLKNSIRKVLGANQIIVRMNRDDMERLNTDSRYLLSDESFSKIKFEADDRIEPGGCLVESEIGNVDARLSSRTDELKKQMIAALTQG